MSNWKDTSEGNRKYKIARAKAQALADESGCDQGLEANDYAKDYLTCRLPRKENRYGYELRCEVVYPSDLSRCQPGHGPLARG